MRSLGLAHHALDVDIEQVMNGPAAQEMARSDNPLTFIRSYLQGTAALKHTMLAVLEEV